MKPIPEIIRGYVLKRDNYRCRYCGEPVTEIYLEKEVENMGNQTWDESTLRSIIRKAIQEGKLFELVFLVFTDEGRRLWATWPEERFKRRVSTKLRKSQGRCEYDQGSEV